MFLRRYVGVSGAEQGAGCRIKGMEGTVGGLGGISGGIIGGVRKDEVDREVFREVL